MVKERGILYKGTMVRAILRGLKTETRRVMNPQPSFVATEEETIGEQKQAWINDNPYGQPGDLLYVKETYRFACDLDGKSPNLVAASALEANYSRPWAPTKYEADDTTVNADVLNDFGGAWGKKRVSIHMPRWASRLTLKIAEVCVEQLQDISEASAVAEGITRITKDDGRTWKYGIPDRDGLPGVDNDGWPWHEWDVSPVKAYRRLWDSINAKPTPVTDRGGKVTHYISHPWEDVRETRRHAGKPWYVVGNPWVFVIRFKRVESGVQP